MSDAEQSTPAVKVLLFASLREAIGTSSISVPLDSTMTVAELKQHVAERFPETEKQLAAVMPARNGAYCKLDESIQSGDEIAFIPPVSGG